MATTKNLQRFLPVLIMGLLLGAFFASGLHRNISLQTLQEQHQSIRNFAQAHPLLAPLAMLLLYTAMVAISFPNASLLTIVCGYMFGLWLGVAVVICGATLGAVLVYLAARTAYGDSLRARAGALLAKLQDGFARNATSYMLVLRLTPLFPFWLINIAAPAFRVPLPVFTMTTFFGIMPASFVYASIGAGAGALLNEGKTLDLRSIFLKPDVLIPIGGLVLLSLLPIVLRKWIGPK